MRDAHFFQPLASLVGKNGMHDFLLAKEIMEELNVIAREKKYPKRQKRQSGNWNSFHGA